MQNSTMTPETSNIRVFWQPGCSSCMRTKELLKKHGVAFESIDVANDPNGMAQLLALGTRSLPIVARGTEFTFCQSISDVINFLKLDTKPREMLPPAQLYAKLDMVLRAAIRYALQFPADKLRENFRNRNRTLGNTAYHVFRVAEMGLETAQGVPLVPAGFADVAPVEWEAADIARWGEEVRQRLAAWWAGADQTLSCTVETYYGNKPMHDVFERTAWHAAQHARQLVLMLDHHGIAAYRPLTADDLAGLPVPDDIWN